MVCVDMAWFINDPNVPAVDFQIATTNDITDAYFGNIFGAILDIRSDVVLNYIVLWNDASVFQEMAKSTKPFNDGHITLSIL